MGNIRQQWRQHVEQWQDSGLTAVQFAAQHGLKPGALRYWKCTLNRQAHAVPQPLGNAHTRPWLPPDTDTALPLVEVRTTTAKEHGQFELELQNGRWLRVPASFEPEALRKLLAVLEPLP